MKAARPGIFLFNIQILFFLLFQKQLLLRLLQCLNKAMSLMLYLLAQLLLRLLQCLNKAMSLMLYL